MKIKPILISLSLAVAGVLLSGCGEQGKPEDGGPVASPGPGVNSPADSGVGAGGAGVPTKSEGGGASSMSTGP
jgi:hypothetical protein